MMASNITLMEMKASKCFEEDKIKVGNNQAGKIAFNKACDKLQEKKYKKVTRYILDM